MSERAELYVVLDPDHTGGRDPLEVARAVLRAGPALLQLRSKTLADRPFLRLARELVSLTHAHNARFVVNDRAAIARLVGADGLHLGQDDLSIGDARRIVDAMPIGVSTHNEEQCFRALSEGADLVAFGPVFETRSKAHPDPVVGVDRLARAARMASEHVRGAPLIAIGGIDRSSAALVTKAGARYAAVIGAVCAAPDPESAARSLIQALAGG